MPGGKKLFITRIVSSETMIGGRGIFPMSSFFSGIIARPKASHYKIRNIAPKCCLNRVYYIYQRSFVLLERGECYGEHAVCEDSGEI